MKLDLFLKDFRLMLEEGQRLGVRAAADEPHPAALPGDLAAGRGGEDLAALITTLERMAGIGE